MNLAHLAGLVALGAAAPLVRLAVHPHFRVVFPRQRWIVVGSLVLWSAIVLCVVVFFPRFAVGAAAVIAAASVVAVWRSRPHSGRRRGLPPGSLSLTRSVRDLARRDHLLELGERHGPVFKGSQFSGTVVHIIGLDRGQRLIREHRSAIGPSPLAFTQQIMGGFLRYMDDETHDLYGNLFRRAMSRTVTDSTAPVTHAAAERFVAGLGDEVDSPDEDLRRIAYESTLYALFGIDAKSDLGVEFGRSYATFARNAVSHPGRRRTRAALAELREIVLRRAVLLHDLDHQIPHCALSELHSLDPSMPDQTCIDNLLFMLRIGSDNVTGLLRWVLEHYGSDLGWQARLQTTHDDFDPALDDHIARRDLLDAFVSETLRLAQSEYLYRRLVDDVEFEGFHLSAGWLVRICVWESHRDPAIFDEPTLMTDRFVGHRRPLTEFCPFGFDRHACNSVGLATMIVRTVLEVIAADPGVIVEPAGTAVRDLRHWSHWRPGPSLGVARLTPPASRTSPLGEVASEHVLQREHVLAKDLDQPSP